MDDAKSSDRDKIPESIASEPWQGSQDPDRPGGMWLLVVALLMGIGVGLYFQFIRWSAEDYYQHGRKLHQEGELLKAASQYEIALRKGLETKDVFYWRAQTRKFTTDPENFQTRIGLVKTHETTLDMGGKKIPLPRLVTHMYYAPPPPANKRYQSMIDDYHQAEDSSIAKEDLRFRTAEAYQHCQQWKNSIKPLSEAIRYNSPNRSKDLAKYHYYTARAHYYIFIKNTIANRSQLKLALKNLKACLDSTPKFVPALFLQYWCNFHVGVAKDVLKRDIKEIIKLDPNYSPALFDQLCRFQGKILVTYIDKVPSGVLLLNWKLYLAQVDKVITSFSRNSVDGRVVWLQYQRARYYHSKEQWKKCLADFEGLLNRNLNYAAKARIRYMRARTYEAMGEPAKAISDYWAAATRAPKKLHHAYLNCWQLNQKHGRPKEAKEAWDKYQEIVTRYKKP